MRLVLGALALVAILSGFPAHAAPSASSPVPLLLDSDAFGPANGFGPESPYRRPYGYRFTGGYYTTEWQWVWIPARVRVRDAFGRAYGPSHGAGRWERKPIRTYVPYTTYYARPHYRNGRLGPGWGYGGA